MRVDERARPRRIARAADHPRPQLVDGGLAMSREWCQRGEIVGRAGAARDALLGRERRRRARRPQAAHGRDDAAMREMPPRACAHGLDLRHPGERGFERGQLGLAPQRDREQPRFDALGLQLLLGALLGARAHELDRLVAERVGHEPQRAGPMLDADLVEADVKHARERRRREALDRASPQARCAGDHGRAGLAVDVAQREPESRRRARGHPSSSYRRAATAHRRRARSRPGATTWPRACRGARGHRARRSRRRAAASARWHREPWEVAGRPCRRSGPARATRSRAAAARRRARDRRASARARSRRDRRRASARRPRARDRGGRARRRRARRARAAARSRFAADTRARAAGRRPHAAIPRAGPRGRPVSPARPSRAGYATRL